MHRYGEATKRDHVSRRRKQGRLCIAATAQRHRQSTPVRLQGYNGAWAALEHASRRREQGRLCIATVRAAAATEHMHRSGESRADYSSQRRNNGRYRACIATYGLDLRLARCLSRGARLDGESSASQVEATATISICTATARVGQTLQGYNGTTDQQVHG